jgi:hypothetical protein
MAPNDALIRIRLPLALRAQIEAAARQSGRSLNREIIRRLVISFPDGYSTAPAQINCSGATLEPRVETESE